MRGFWSASILFLAASAAAAEPSRLGSAELDAVVAGAWQGYSVSVVGAQAQGNALATTRTRNQATYVSVYQWQGGRPTATVTVEASAQGSGFGSGPGASSAQTSGRLIVAAQRRP